MVASRRTSRPLSLVRFISRPIPLSWPLIWRNYVTAPPWCRPEDTRLVRQIGLANSFELAVARLQPLIRTLVALSSKSKFCEKLSRGRAAAGAGAEVISQKENTPGKHATGV